MAASARHRRFLGVALLVLACGCASDDGADRGDLPEIPALSVESLPAPERQQLENLLAAVRAAPRDAEANGTLGRALHANEQYQGAEAFYARAAALEPGALRWLYYLGVVRSAQGKYESAAQAFEAAAGIDSSFVPLQQKLAETRLSLNEPEKARALYERLLQETPQTPVALFGLGRAWMLEGEPEKAVERFEQAVEAAPQYAAAHYELALAYRDRGDDELSARHLELYEQYKQLPPPSIQDPLMASVESMKRGAGDRIARGIALAEQGDIPGAIREHLAALEADPSLAQAHVNLVQLYGRTGDAQKAAEHYAKALDLAPGQADLHYNYGVLLFENGRLAEAKKAFERAVASNPDYAAGHNNLGQIAEREGKLDEAMRSYRKALQAQPNFRLARFHLGRMLLAKRAPQEAAEQLQRALEPTDEMTPHVLFGLATAHVQLGDIEGAKRLGGEARALAEQTGQPELAQRIADDLATLR